MAEQKLLSRTDRQHKYPVRLYSATPSQHTGKQDDSRDLQIDNADIQTQWLHPDKMPNFSRIQSHSSLLSPINQSFLF